MRHSYYMVDIIGKLVEFYDKNNAYRIGKVKSVRGKWISIEPIIKRVVALVPEYYDNGGNKIPTGRYIEKVTIKPNMRIPKNKIIGQITRRFSGDH